MTEPGWLGLSGHDPSATALIDAGVSITYRQLLSDIDRFAEKLLFPGKALVFLFPYNDRESVTAYLACAAAGHAIVLLNPDLDPDFQKRLVALFHPDFVIAPASRPAEFPEYQAGAPPQPEVLLLRALRPREVPLDPALGVLISTSGSTGSPKLVRLSWRAVEANARQINQALGNRETDRVVLTAPMFNGFGLSLIHTHLLAGGSLVLTREHLFRRPFWDAVREARCNTIGGVPGFYQTLDLLDLDSLCIPLVTRFLQTGGRMPGRLAVKFHGLALKRGGALHLMYGQAEATARISALPPECLPEAAGSVGFPLADGRVTVQDGAVVCGPMEEGELIYEGPNVMMGYATRQEDLALGDVLHGRLFTGDLGYRDPQGLVYITGRRSRFVKMFGWRVSLDDVEEMLSHAGPVAAVNEQERVVVYAEMQASGRAALEREVAALAARLRLHPSGFEVRVIANLPRFAAGKIDYGALTAGVRTTIPAPAAVI